MTFLSERNHTVSREYDLLEVVLGIHEQAGAEASCSDFEVTCTLWLEEEFSSCAQRNRALINVAVRRGADKGDGAWE